MYTSIFKIVQNALEAIGRKTGFTYNEVNIIVYFFGIPFSWLCLLDIIFGGHWGKAAFVIFTLGFMAGCRNFKKYSDWLFDKSVAFLNYFNRYGSNYMVSSVWICVCLPIVIYAVLIFFALK
jgi:uncharacterized membrane protein required for colicin V production